MELHPPAVREDVAFKVILGMEPVLARYVLFKLYLSTILHHHNQKMVQKSAQCIGFIDISCFGPYMDIGEKWDIKFLN